MEKTTTVLIMLLILAVSFITFEKGSAYLEQERNKYYNQGGENGVTYWNNQVIDTVNQQGVIPFIINRSVQSIPIQQLCGRLE